MKRKVPATPLSESHVWLRRVQRHRGKCAVWSASVLVVVLAATALTPRWYRSEGAMYLRLGRENAALDPTAALGQTLVVAPGSREREVNTVLEMLKSRGQAEAVVDQGRVPNVSSSRESSCAARASRMGTTVLQGTHHSAQKSTSTGCGEPRTSLAQVWSV